jgi:hypothetical protein
VVLWPPLTSGLDLVLSRKPWPPPMLFEFTDSSQFRPTPWPPPLKYENTLLSTALSWISA